MLRLQADRDYAAENNTYDWHYLTDYEVLNPGHLARCAVDYRWDGVCATIWSVRTQDDFQGRGYCQELMKRTMRRLKRKGITTVNLWVDHWNEPARHIYEKVGFVYTDPAQDTGQLWMEATL
jgi:RimJ/RimL family protein N-acetyltransferase